MSRWDALKTDETQTPQRTNANSGHGWATQGRPALNHARRQPLRKMRSYDEILTTLMAAKEPEELENAVRELSAMKLEDFRKIPAEQAANDLVDKILLETLNKTENSPRLERAIIDAINELLREPSICSAVTSPLTIDVAQATGIEERIPNPVGEKLLLALQLRLPQSCSTLTTLVDEIRKRSIADTLRVDVVQLHHFFAKHLSIRHLQTESLELLRLVLVTYPDSYKALKTLLLGDFRNKRDGAAHQCSACQYKQGTSLLMDLLHDRHCTSQVTTCIVLFLNSFPLELWLNPKTVGSMKIFGENVKIDLLQLIRTSICRFSPVEHFCTLVAMVLTTIPYPDDANDKLTREAMTLVSCVANTVMDGPSQKDVMECLCECMGGRPRPNGGNTLISTPANLWLVESSAFQDYIFANVGSANSSSRFAATKLLSAIVRTRPGFTGWQQFQAIVQSKISTTQYRAEGMTLLETFAIGRSEFAASIPTANDIEISRFLVQTFNAMAFDGTGKVRLSCLQGYCALLATDWSYAVESGEIEASIDRMTHYSQRGAASEKPQALKAIGEMLSKCSSGDESSGDEDVVEDDRFTHICSTVLPFLQNGLKESNAAKTKSMAIFAIGNLALGIRERNSQRRFLPPFSLLPMVDQVCACISAPNDKVIGNAIRTLGHLSYLAFHEPYVSHLSRSDSAVRFQMVVAKLTEKLRHAMGGNASSKLTWKERSSAKKHGWGSCHSLGLLLGCDVAIQNLDESREACAALINCIKQHTALSEKIVLAANAALKRLEPTHLESLSRRTGLVGLALSCCLELMVDRSVNSRVKTEVEQLMLCTVPILSVLDACAVLQSEDITSSHLEWLYNWMLKNNLNAEAYEQFAMAFDQTDHWDSNVSLEQRFASRAAWGYREGTHESANEVRDEDEL